MGPCYPHFSEQARERSAPATQAILSFWGTRIKEADKKAAVVVTAEGPDAEGGPEGKNKKPGRLSGGPSAVEHSPYWNSAGTQLKSQLKTWLFKQALPPAN